MQDAGMFLCFYSTILVFIALFNLRGKGAVICIPTLNGRYTRDIVDFKLTVPFKTTQDGGFVTYKIPNFYQQNFEETRRRRRALDDPEMVHYSFRINSKSHQAELWPNHGLVSPNAVVENREPNTEVGKRDLKNMNLEKLCHYTGQIRGVSDSKVALSTCNGLAGYIAVGKKRYFIEPVEEHAANEEGQHLHVVYERSAGEKEGGGSRCGTSSNWEEVWKKRFYDKYIKEGDLKVKRGDTSLHRYLETLIVCDKKFLEHHKNTDIETYVLTVMNMVSDFYHDSSSGNQMDVVVVRIMYLAKEEEEIDLVINANAEDTLASFCKWQQKINPKDIANPNHHDIAVLLTRYDICSDNLSNCGLMGLAYVASACTGNEPCAINEDGGLVLGIVVAHEMGHVMGCAHDKEGESSCPAQDKDESFFVMAPFVHLYTTRWSTCSRTFITSLFDNDLGECLNDEPEISLYRDRNLLPGTVYDAEEQCRMAYPNSKVCHVNEDTFCEMLLCQTGPTECLSNGEPPADGTKCGENMWCYRKKCVAMGSRPEAVNGGWGEWGSWSTCSRTCGAGVTFATRDCDSPVPEHRGRYCIGERKKVKICNTTPCPAGSPSFREVQCSDHDNKPFQGKMLKWRQFLKPDEPCVLYCLSSENVYAKLEPRAKDGTRCKLGTRNMCISGVCRKIGCDWEVDSEAIEDICGICNGDGTQCNIVDKTYTGPPGRGYHKVVTFPADSRNVLVEELATSTNTIAVSDSSEKKYFLNGDYSEQADGDINFGEITGVYSHPERGKENLIIHGPLTEDLVLFVVFYTPENVGYRYKYAEPSIDITAYTPKYHWEQDDWEECSAKCGGGRQTALYTCVEEKVGKVSSSFCGSLDKPEPLTKTCNERPCTAKWKTGKWGKCHACKFKSGVRMRQVECVRESPHPGTEDVLVEDSECTEERPGTRELCNSHKKCKSRRYTDGLPDEMMEDIWKQIHNVRVRRSDDKERAAHNLDGKKQFDKNLSADENGKKCKAQLNVGKTVKDTIPKEEIKLIRVPLKQSRLSLNLSDNAFETMGDKVADSLDTGKAKIATGETAANFLKSLQHANQSDVP